MPSLGLAGTAGDTAPRTAQKGAFQQLPRAPRKPLREKRGSDPSCGGPGQRPESTRSRRPCTALQSSPAGLGVFLTDFRVLKMNSHLRNTSWKPNGSVGAWGGAGPRRKQPCPARRPQPGTWEPSPLPGEQMEILGMIITEMPPQIPLLARHLLQNIKGLPDTPGPHSGFTNKEIPLPWAVYLPSP